MHQFNVAVVQRRLDELAPFFQALGDQTRRTYERAGILAAMPDASFPVSDARFIRRDNRIMCHPRGAVYFTITRNGELTLFNQMQGVMLPSALTPYVQLGRIRDLRGPWADDTPTEWFPPPRLVLDTGTSDLFIATISRDAGSGSTTVFVPLEQYLTEHARLFVEAFHAIG